ncbi:MAG: magnesium transporter [Clostridiales bacterium]|nr:magnesium transporter [Clostridiales bacterium]
MKETITALLQEKQITKLYHLFEDMAPADIAEELKKFEDEKLPVLYRLLPKDMAAEVFVEMDGDEQEFLIQSFTDKELREVISELYLDDAVDIIEEMPASVVGRILRNTKPSDRKTINELLNYPKDSAGSIMTTEYVDLKSYMTVQEAFGRIRQVGLDKETVYTCYVVDQARKLLGIVTVREMLFADENTKIENIMDTNIIFAATSDDKEDVVNKMKKYDFLALPIVDAEARLVGIVTIDDAIDVLEEEATEDIEKMAAITPTKEDVPYLKLSVFSLFKARIPWQLLLMISATFTGIIITSFEQKLASVTILTAFIPMLMDTGGNTGSQSSVTIIRAISLKEIEFHDIFKIIWKEIRVAVLCGLTLAVINFFKILLFDGWLMGNESITPVIAAVICITLVLTVFCAKFVGCILPLVSHKLGFDPAVMSSPFITTIVDAISLLIYFQTASALLHI